MPRPMSTPWPPVQDGPQRLARIITFRHLAGEKQACDLAAAAAVKLWSSSSLMTAIVSDALMLNDRVDQAIEAARRRTSKLAFELLAAQNRLKEAFRLVKIDVPIPAKIDWAAWLKDGKGEVTPERLLLARQVVRALHLAGEDEQARELIAAMLASISEKLPEERLGSQTLCC